MKLLIAYDGSRCSDSAMDDLTHAGLPETGQALVISVVEMWLPPPPPSTIEIVELATTTKGALGLERKYMANAQVVRDADEMASGAAARFQANFPRWTIKHESVWGSPNWEVFSKAEEWKADLIVVGSHGRTALGRFFLGSISQWLLNEARCSVRVARGKLDEPDFPVRLLLALDGSVGAEKALEEIASRNWPAKSEVRVVMVDQPLELTYIGGMAPPLRDSIDSFNHDEHDRSLRIVKAAVEKLEKAGLRATGNLFEGDPKKVLVKVAEEWRADCVFVGATGVTNKFERFLLGSTAAAIAARAHCSVEVVRRRRRGQKTNGNRN
ncbi:MAG TPA: universal stress protein [Pyrinomonadaceae bacterium]|nr:universal stress protein [Pyrinomonadaceae bacterium]